MTPQKIDLTTRVAQALADATGEMPRDTAEEQDAAYKAEAATARAFLGGVVDEFTEALVRACVSRGHRGAVAGRDGVSGTPCAQCKPKVRHYREVAALIAPDRRF